MPLKSMMKTVAFIGAMGSVMALHCSTTDHISGASCASQGLFLDSTRRHADTVAANISVLEDAFEALSVLQETYFDPNYGTWPGAIDWTAAVCETVLSGTLSTLTKSWELIRIGGKHELQLKENLISYYYEHIVNFYATQDQLTIRGEAYDDILWVVLGWLEAINFVSTHAKLRYPETTPDNSTVSGVIERTLMSLPWYGQYWVRDFAHRARIFWNLATRGWDTKLCHGGMVWNSRLEPYKNAITNELWISASISMYRDFPGDNFTSPWAMDGGFPDKDPRHLAAAVEGYRWLQEVNMTNSLGLFVDGYHISSKTPGNVECDERDEMVYTYNQGVILSGQRSLWAVTGSPSYLDDGHRLIQSVISATGWSLRANSAVDKPEHFPQGQLPPWRGLGRGGILEEQCDASGTCSQDAQTFKGIFFHHFAAFCSTLDPLHDSDGDGDEPRPAGQGLDAAAHKGISQAHTRACNAYLAWVRHNYLAALRSRDERGRFGMWWGAGAAYGRGRDVLASPATDGIDHDAENTTDYRNEGTPLDAVWGSGDRWLPGRRRGQGEGAGGDGGIARQARQQVPKQTMAEHLLNPASRMRPGQFAVGAEDPSHRLHEANDKDPNSRGRGRTVETQMGGLALLRAYWEVSQSG